MKKDQTRKQPIVLFMGCSFGTEDALKYAKSKGIYTIITANELPVNGDLVKMADEFWQIDVGDVDLLEKKCRQKQVTGLFAATSEFCLDKTKVLCKRLHLPFYASDEGWACARDKKRFRKHCIKCGLDVPRSYQTESVMECEINYPVIVKPVDSCAQQGTSICRNKDELQKGIAYAMTYSASQNVLIEEYIEGDELAVMYYFVDGKPVPVEIVDMIYMQVNGRKNFTFVKQDSRYKEEYLKDISPKVEKLFEHMKCENGVAFVQIIRKSGRYYFLELGYRINGGGSWEITKKFSGISSVEFMVDCALGHKYRIHLDSQTDLNPMHKAGGMYLIWSRPGRIGKIEGLDEINRIDDIKITIQNFKAGDEIPKDISMRQIAFFVAVVADSNIELQKKISEINKTLHIYDRESNDMLYYLKDFENFE